MIFLDNCGGYGVLKIIKFIFNILDIILLIAPMVLIIMLTIDFAKAVISNNEDEMKKNQKTAIRRLIMCMAMFLVGAIVYAGLNLLPDFPNYQECIEKAKEDIGKYNPADEYKNNSTNSSSGNKSNKTKSKSVISSSNGSNSTGNSTNKEYNILIVGNSKTYRTQGSKSKTRVAIIFANILKNEGIIGSASFDKKKIKSGGYLNRNDEVTIVTENGKTLKYLSKETGYSQYMKDRSYNIVIMQEQTATARSNYSSYVSGAQEIANLQKNKNTKIYIRTQWQDIDQGNSTLEKFNNNAEKVSNKLSNEGFSANVIYDGNALMAARSSYKTSKLYDDSYHPSNIGAYLSAACAYKTIFGKNASNLKYNKSIYNDKYSINSSDFEKLNKIVDNNC